MMFRRFFARFSRPHNWQQLPEGLPQQLMEAAGESDDAVHRMALRLGNQAPPEDGDEHVYAGDQGDHAELAGRALRDGDLKRSIFHLGLALADDPGREDWLALLDRWIIAAGPQALSFVPLNDEHYFGTLQAAQQLMRMGNRPDHRMEVHPLVGKHYHAKVAVHAYILASQGRIGEAISLLLHLIQVKPEIPYILWLQRWQDQPGFATALDPMDVARIGAQLIQKFPGVYVFSRSAREEIARYLPLFQVLYTTYPDWKTKDGHISTIFLYSTLLRKAGFFEEAARVARVEPPLCYSQCATRAMAEKALGNLEAGIAAYKHAMEFEPRDVAVRNDLGELYLTQGKLPEALAWYEESMRLDPSDPFQLAAARVVYFKHLQAPGSGRWLSQLQQLAQQQQSARHLHFQAQAPYLGRLPHAGEAIINLWRGIEERLAKGEIKRESLSTLKVGLSNIESPSALLAVQRSLEALGVPLSLVVDRVPTPDIRQPLRPVEYQIWRYEGMDPVPNVPPPDPAIAARISSLAQIPYALDVWHDPARVLGQSLGPQALMSLLGVMVHPPAAPDGWEEDAWIIAVQLASVLVLAYLDAGWEGSRRKAALTSLAYGPMDWSGAAAMMALAVLARQDMRINIEFDRLCLDLWSLEPDLPWALEEALVMGLIFVDSYSQEAEEKIEAYFERLRREREEE
jgi:tetratricopeptide (TPR) repeat protein